MIKKQTIPTKKGNQKKLKEILLSSDKIFCHHRLMIMASLFLAHTQKTAFNIHTTTESYWSTATGLGDTICLLFVTIGRTLFRTICSSLFTDRNDTFNQRLTARFVY